MLIQTTLNHLSKMGQREIARSHPACMLNLLAAGGAGLVTAGTVMLKILILKTPFTEFEGGVLVMLNFAVSFLLMQILGFRLATKQAPLFGAALGRKWKDVGWSTRTQFFSALGNFAFVIPAAFVFHFIFESFTQTTLLSPAGAEAALRSLHPGTGTLAFAAFTGGILWFCTFLGGLVANYFGPFSKTQATTFFNISLGAMLAFTPILGKWLGVPIDVRHFTLSGGTVAIAVASLGFKAALSSGLPMALLGVLLIGLLNFSVSFALGFIASSIGGSFTPMVGGVRVEDLTALVIPRGLTFR